VALANLRHETAARMIAEDCETDQHIATAVGVSRRTIANWKNRPDIKARIEEIADEAGNRIAAHYERLQWLRERESCRMGLNSTNSLTRTVSLMRLQEMGAT